MRRVALPEIADIFNGKTPSKADQRTAGHPVLKVKDLDALGSFRGDFESFVDSEFAERYRTKWACPGDTVILNAAHNASHVASKTAILPEAVNGALLTGEWLVVRSRANADPRYVYYWLSSPGARAELKDAVKGIHLYPRDVARLLIPLPPLDEQRRIAAILDHADALLTKRRQVLAHLDTLTQSIFHDMFGDKAGSKLPLGELADVTSGITKGRRTSEPTTIVPYLAVANVQSGHLIMDAVKEIEATPREIERFALRHGDLLLTEGGDPDKLGRGTVWRNELPLCLHQNHIFRVRLSDKRFLLPDYLAAFVRSPFARNYFLRCAKQTTGIASINLTQLKALQVTVPSVGKQGDFLARLEAIAQQVRRSSRDAELAEETFASLQVRAFGGAL